ncbi:hypothetical protein BC332_25065 [Capsicum chinense]|nr:hypothetical protein BC332_25065 [Capsicum chinense]
MRHLFYAASLLMTYSTLVFGLNKSIYAVVGNNFVRDPVTFSNQSNTFDQAFSDFSTRSKKETRFVRPVVVDMAEGTRSKVVEDQVARHEEIFAELVNQQQELRNSQTGIQGTLELILDRLTNLERAPNRRNGDQPLGDGLLPIPWQENRNNRGNMVPIPPRKWELPSFDGQEPKVWIRTCERYFNLYRTIEQQKVEADALCLNGVAEIRYHSLVMSRAVIGWAEFKEELCSRFSVEPLENVVEEFNKLSQTGSVDELLVVFEEWKPQMFDEES